jgi:chaperonin GroEL
MDSSALETLVFNHIHGKIKACAVKSPAFGDRRSAIMQDMAILTGGVFVSESTGTSLATIQIDQLGSCKKVVISRDDTIIIDGASNHETVEARRVEIKYQIDECVSDYERDMMTDRLAKLSGGVAIIKVGAATETEMSEIKDRIDDALSATRAAIKEGIVVGGGCALIHAQNSILTNDYDGDELYGSQIISKAIEAPLRCIIKNSGRELSAHISDIRKGDDNFGYDAKTNTLCDLMEVGVIDPVKVTRCALQHAASIAGLLLTMEVLISIIPVDKKDNAPGNQSIPGMF